jgi:sortase B
MGALRHRGNLNKTVPFHSEAKKEIKKKKRFFQKTEKKDSEDEKQDKEKALVPVKKISLERRIVRWLDRITDRILIFLCVILLLLGGYALLDTIHIYYHANDKSLLNYKPEVDENGIVRDPVSLPGAVGWLTLGDTNIDYPIMQGLDNSAYLNKDPYGNYSLSGSLFLDANNASDFTDQYSMIYGHHMEHDAMFGALEEFLNEDYFAKHRSGSIIIGNKSYKLILFAALECNAYQKEIFDVKYGGALTYIKENAGIYYDGVADEYSQILAMSTCQEADSDQRTVIFAVIVGGPGTLNPDGSQHSTTTVISGDVDTGQSAGISVYIYWTVIAVACTAAGYVLVKMKKKK